MENRDTLSPSTETQVAITRELVDKSVYKRTSLFGPSGRNCDIASFLFTPAGTTATWTCPPSGWHAVQDQLNGQQAVVSDEAGVLDKAFMEGKLLMPLLESSMCLSEDLHRGISGIEYMNDKHGDYKFMLNAFTLFPVVRSSSISKFLNKLCEAITFDQIVTSFSRIPRINTPYHREYVEYVRGLGIESGLDMGLPKRFSVLVKGRRWSDIVADFLGSLDAASGQKKVGTGSTQKHFVQGPACAIEPNAADQQTQSLAQANIPNTVRKVTDGSLSMDPHIGNELRNASDRYRAFGVTNMAKANLCDCAYGIFNMLQVRFL